jgi:amino acid transporter
MNLAARQPSNRAAPGIHQERSATRAVMHPPARGEPRGGLLPPGVGTIHPIWGTPYRITAVMTAGVALLAGFVPLKSLANLVSIGTLFAFVIVSLAVPVLRRTRPLTRGRRGRPGSWPDCVAAWSGRPHPSR